MKTAKKKIKQIVIVRQQKDGMWVGVDNCPAFAGQYKCGPYNSAKGAVSKAIQDGRRVARAEDMYGYVQIVDNNANQLIGFVPNPIAPAPLKNMTGALS